MRILVDMDGVLADFDQHLFNVAEEAGWTVDIPEDAARSHWLTDHFPHSWQARLARVKIERTNWFRDLPEIPGAIEGLKELAAEHDVWICTKPLEKNINCRDDKARWIRRRIPELERKLIITPNKSLINADILLDDAIRHDWAATASWNPVIYRQDYNGLGTQWEGWPNWAWGDSIEDLLIAGLQAKSDYL